MQEIKQYFYKIINYNMFKKIGHTIALIDSGIGGISILKQLIKNGGNYIYFADNDFMPYGKRSKSKLKKRLNGIISLLENKFNVDKIIIACNTASTLIENTNTIMTMRFITDKVYLATSLSKKNLKNYEVIADSTLATQIEKHIFDKSLLDKIIKKHILKYQLNNLEEFVLGCTHYELVYDIFCKYCPKTKIYRNSEFILNDIIMESTTDINIKFITICVEFMVI